MTESAPQVSGAPSAESSPTLIIGANASAAALIRELRKKKSRVTVVGVLDGNGCADKEIEGVPFLGKLHKLAECVWQHKVTRLIQCGNMEQTFNIQAICRQFNIEYLLHMVGEEAE